MFIQAPKAPSLWGMGLLIARQIYFQAQIPPCSRHPSAFFSKPSALEWITAWRLPAHPRSFPQCLNQHLFARFFWTLKPLA